MEPLVSICTTTYQHRRYIRQTLDSFLSQKTDFPFEILVHDDCSGDGTVEILEEYARRYPDVVCPVFEKENQYSKGVPINETFNFPRARGKYIALCEGDDFWCDDGKLQAQADYMESHPDCTFCFTNGYIVEESQSFGPDWREHAREFVPYYESERPAYYGADHRYDLGEIAALSFVPTAGFFFPRALWEQVSEAYHHRMCEHGDLKMRLYFTALGSGEYLHRYACVYRENVPGSAFQVWKKENAVRTARRAASVVDMLDEVDEMTGGRYRAGLAPLRDRYLFVELWNTDEKHPAHQADLRRVRRQLPLKQKCVYAAKHLLPRRWIDALKRRGAKESKH